MSKLLAKDGKEFSIRRPTADDAENIIRYSQVLFASTDQVLTTLEEYVMTVENEKVWIHNFNENPNALLLMAERNSQIIGLLFFAPNLKRKNSHTGEFGVSVHPDFQGIGMGRHLIEALLNWARNHNQIEKVFLNVFNTNQHAIKLYSDMGFIVEGRHVKAIKQLTGEYVDALQMYMETR